MQRPLSLSVAAAAAAMGLFATGLGLASTGSGTLKLSAKLDPRHELPAPKGAHGAGGFLATLAGRTLTWKLTYAGLTGKAVAAHIHLGRPGVSGPVAVPLCGPCVSGVHGKVVVSAKVRAALAGGGAYVNVHTAKNPGGEIRGQVLKPGAVAPASPSTSTTSTDTSGGYGYGYRG